MCREVERSRESLAAICRSTVWRELALEVNKVSAKQSHHSLNSVRQIGVRLKRDEIRLAQNRQLGFEAEKITFCGPVQLPLFRRGVTSIAVSDGARRGQCG